jgi:hypothetical protein
MKRIARLPLILLFGSITLTGQSFGQNQPQNTVTQISPLVNSCPVSLHARHAPGGDMIKVDAVPINGIAQLIHLTVANPDSKQIVAANITVRGFTDKGRLIQVMSNQDSYDARKTIDVKFSAGAGKEVSANLSLPGFSAVSLIDLNSVTYSDGSNWKLAPGNSCRSWIDGLMLVSGH